MTATVDHVVPGTVSFELEQLELVDGERLELSGRWFGVRGRRFVRPTLMLLGKDEQVRLLADLTHKPWIADEGQSWDVAFPYERHAGPVEEIELAVAPDITVALPPPAALRKPPPSRRNRTRAASVRPRDPDAPARVGAIRQRDQAVRERDDALRAREQAVRQRDEGVRARSELGRALAAARAERDELARRLERSSAELEERDARLKRVTADQVGVARHLETAQANLAAQIRDCERLARERADAVAARAAAVAARDAANAALDAAVAERDAAIATNPQSAPAPHDVSPSSPLFLRVIALALLLAAALVLLITIQSA